MPTSLHLIIIKLCVCLSLSLLSEFFLIEIDDYHILTPYISMCFSFSILCMGTFFYELRCSVAT